MTTPDPTNGCALPAQPDGTPYDGDPLFEALVFGWTTSTPGWNGELGGPAGPIRRVLAGYFAQFLEQTPDPAVGERVMFCPGGDVATAVRVGSSAFMHGEVVESTPQVIRVKWDGSPSVGRFDADSFDKLVREPSAVRR